MDEFSERAQHYQQVLEATLGMPFSNGNRIQVLRNGVEIFPAMLAAIRQARISIEFLTFVYWRGDIAQRFAQALSERAKAGAQVRVILDAVGAAAMDGSLVSRMESAGVEVIWFRPPVRWKVWEIDNRTHRKVLICDGKVAFTGGVGIAAEWEGNARSPKEWRETHFQVEGPAVHGLQAAFIDNWAEAGRPVHDNTTRIQPLGREGEAMVQVMKTAASVNWSSIATLMHILLDVARHKLRITTAYFVPNETILRKLKEAVERGVDIQILIPGPHHDQRMAQLAQEDEYAPLMEAGVRMFSYQPTMLHAKVVTMDGTVAAVGSANFNQRSMSKDDELMMMVIDRPTLELLDQHFDEDRARAVELQPENFRRRRPLRKLKSRFLSLFRHQM